MKSLDELRHIVADLRRMIEDRGKTAFASHRAAPNSYGDGYDNGYVDGLKDVYYNLIGEEP